MKSKFISRLAIATLVFAILFPALLFVHALVAVKESAKFSQRQGVCFSIGAALERYFHKYGRYPQPVTFGPKQVPFHSWRILIQEFMDTELYDAYDFGLPWDHEKNRKVLNTRNHFAATDPSNGETEYFCVYGPNSFYESCTKDKQPDGVHFLLVEQLARKTLWTEPADLTLDDIRHDTPLDGKLIYLFRRDTHGSAFRMLDAPDPLKVQQAFSSKSNEIKLADLLKYPP